VRPYTGGFRARVRAGCADSVSGARRWLGYTGGFRARVCGRVATLLLSLAVRPYKGVFPALIRVHRLGSSCVGRACFFALIPDPFPTWRDGGVGAHGGSPCGAFPLACEAGEGNTADKGTPATHIWRARGMGFRRQDPPCPALSPLVKGRGSG
jgi:hypothetical protein